LGTREPALRVFGPHSKQLASGEAFGALYFQNKWVDNKPSISMVVALKQNLQIQELNMKQIGSLRKSLMICAATLVAAALTSAAYAQAMKQGTAIVRAIHGDAKYSTDGGVWIPLKANTVLRSGTTIQTGAGDSRVDLYLPENGPVIRVTANTTVSLDRLAFSKTGADDVIDTQLNLRTGRIQGNVKKLAAASKYEIKTPNAIAGIRGTEYDISSYRLADGTIQDSFTSITGTLVVAEIGGPTVVVRTGETFVTGGVGVGPTPPQILAGYAPFRSAVPQIIAGPTVPVPPVDIVEFIQPVIEIEQVVSP
jgi:hypothetical protein